MGIPAVTACLLMSGLQAFCTTVTFTTFDVPGATRTIAYGINNSGEVVGSYYDLQGNSAGFELSGTSLTILNVPDLVSTTPRGIDSAGDIVGYAQTPGFNLFHAFRFTNGSYTVIDVPGAQSTFGTGINDAGQIAGYYCIFCGILDEHGFSATDNTFQTIDFRGNQTEVLGISRSGQLVGDSAGRGFLLSSGTFTDIDFPDQCSTLVTGINAAGTIVGTYLCGGGEQGAIAHGFELIGGTFTTIDFPGARSTYLYGINDENIIVGAEDTHAFVAAPTAATVPEPASLVFIAGGLALFWFKKPVR